MMRDLTQALADWIAGDGREIGEVRIERAGEGFLLCHRADESRGDLVEMAGVEAARELAHFDAAGKFRPLKTAPNLRRGWKLRLTGIVELRRALDYFYPAMLGVWLSQRQGRLVPVPLRDTLARQTGMYAVTKKITDAQAQTMIGGFCRSDGGCLKHILWPIAPGVPVTSLPEAKFQPPAVPGVLPLLCHEACNLLVAKAREVVKRSEAPA
jgi:sirohydrochlorin cobaltochelatase